MTMTRRRRVMRICTVCGYAVFCALGTFDPPADAAVDNVGPGGFTVVDTADVLAPPAQVYDALIAPARWWSSAHTYSHDTANLTFDAKAGGCWCETLSDGGSVQHLVVVNAMPGKMLRLRGALGPLQGMAVDGAMTFALQPLGKASRIILTYAVGGYSTSGFAEIAKGVDDVLDEQIGRLKRYVETGRPDSANSAASMEGGSK